MMGVIFITGTLLLIIPTCLAEKHFWNVSDADQDHHKKFAALLVHRHHDSQEQKFVENFCMGVVLNDRYILTVYECSLGLVKIFLGFNHYRKNETNEEIMITSDGTGYEAEKIIDIIPSIYDELDKAQNGFLSLIRTKTKITFDAHVSCINLPNGLLWQHMMPENVTSYFFHGEDLKVKEGIRNCTYDEIKNAPMWLISSCLHNKFDVTIWETSENLGPPLMQNNTVIGMKYYRGIPQNETEKYISIALYAKILESHMEDFTSCTT